MKCTFDIDPKYKELEVRVCSDRETKEAKEVFRTVQDFFDRTLMAYRENEAIPINGKDIIRIFGQNKKVYVTTAEGTFLLHERLYELEEKLDSTKFLRISGSEIVNLYKIERLDTGITGTIRMYLQENMETYVSRRYVTKIKKALGI